MVLRRRRYAAVAAGAGAALGLAYYALTMQGVWHHAGAGAAHVAASAALTALVAGLGGINVALAAYRASSARARGRGAGGSVMGGALAAFAPGCPACTAPLAVVLGAAGGVAALPLQGLELKAVAACALAASVYWIGRGLEAKSCCRAG